MPEATIILPNYNNERVLPWTFKYLRNYLDCSRYAFVMVDDGSVDRSVATAKRVIPGCKFAAADVIECPHQGVVSALNTGLDATKTEFVVRIDGDATVETPNWVSMFIQMLHNDQVGLVGAHVLWEDGRVHTLGRSVFSEYGLYDMGCCPLEPIGRRTFDSIVYRPHYSFQNGAPYEVDTLLGVCVAFRRSDAQAVGGFDLQYNPVWIEDDDFGVEMRRLGKRIIVDPSIHVTHRLSLRGNRNPNCHQLERNSASRSTLGTMKAKVGGARRRLRAAFTELRGKRSAAKVDLVPMESDAWRAEILSSHYLQWKKKWGFDPINPDMETFFNTYWDTQLCWRSNPAFLTQSRVFIRELGVARR
jgi:GT2 family glycosyltransferase